MGRLTDTQVVRTYLDNNIGRILDVSYDSEHVFSNIPESNLRKYIARFVKEGKLRKISKGIYAIGESKYDDYERVVNHYTGGANGIPCGKTLLNEYGFISTLESYNTFMTNKTIGNKIIEGLGIKLFSTKMLFGPSDIKGINIAIDLIDNKYTIEQNKLFRFNELIFRLLKEYSDEKFKKSIEIRYGRTTYLELDKYLQIMGISNRVMDIYESKVKFLSNKE